MKKKTIFLIALIGYFYLTLANQGLAETSPIIPYKNHWMSIASNSLQSNTIPFTAIDKESTYQITVTKALPAPYKSKICLHDACLQKTMITDKILAETKMDMQVRVYSGEVVPGIETSFRYILGPLEESSRSVSGSVYVYPVERKDILFRIDSKEVKENDRVEMMDVGPVIVQSRTYVPFRYLSTVFGAQVSWEMNPVTKLVSTVTYKMGSFSLTLNIGSSLYTIRIQNEKQEKTMDGKPFISKGRTLVPLRVISESLCSQVGWDPVTREVHIQFPKEDSPANYQDYFYQDTTSEAVHERMVNNEAMTILDVRTESDFQKGHIPGAKNIHLLSLKDVLPYRSDINPNLPVIVYCNTGVASAFACEIITNLGYKSVWNITSGFVSWKYDIEK
ncbi:hypothetical protein LLG10_02180 [bacterium]|nr:hypothetical protein [bacterium]